MTDKTRLKSRVATRADIHEYYGQLPAKSVRARVLEVDGRIVGVAGYYIEGSCAVVFSDAKEDIPKMTVWREAKAMMQSIRLRGVCTACEGSGPFLERLGWKHMGEGVYEWQL